jgi:hypothetical protein
MIQFDRTELELRAKVKVNQSESNRIESKSIETNRIEFRVRIKFESFTVL